MDDRRELQEIYDKKFEKKEKLKHEKISKRV
jgi:hypothetical protein